MISMKKTHCACLPAHGQMNNRAVFVMKLNHVAQGIGKDVWYISQEVAKYKCLVHGCVSFTLTRPLLRLWARNLIVCVFRHLLFNLRKKEENERRRKSTVLCLVIYIRLFFFSSARHMEIHYAACQRQIKPGLFF